MLISNNNKEKDLETIDGNQLGETPQEVEEAEIDVSDFSEPKIEKIYYYSDYDDSAVLELEVGESVIV